MEFITRSFKNKQFAELKSEFALKTNADFMDLIGNASYLELYDIIVHKHQLPEMFFDLKTGFAGEVLQKFSTYKLSLAIIGDFSAYKSKSLNDFIRESNRVGRIMFVNTINELLYS